MFRLLRWIITGLVVLASPATAQTRVDLELILAVDVSRSMTPRELEIQRRGYAAALTSDEVVEAIGMGPNGRIALMYVEWAGYLSQREIVPWTLIAGRADAQAFADRLTAEFNTNLRRTSISGVIDYAVPLFESNAFDSFRQVIDISGDGPNNMGRPVLSARNGALMRGITINGLPLMTREGMGSQWHLDDLDVYYRECVIGGPGAFVIPVLDWDHFPAAVRRKLVLELVGREPDAPVRRVQGYDCLIGEKIWDTYFGDWN